MNGKLSNHREPWVDGLRALAILGVFIVNALGYPFAPDYPSYAGMPQPLSSVAASVLHGFIVALIAGKAWLLLCLLIGYSLADIALRLRAQNRFNNSILRVRYWKLLAVGMLHGTLIYFGDILTAYAVCALISSRWVVKRPKAVVRIFKKLSVVVIFLVALTIIFGLALLSNPEHRPATNLSETLSFKLFLSNDVFTFWILNLQAYFSMLINALFFLPVMLWLVVAGMLIRRFRLFSTRRVARIFWARHLGTWQLWVALLLNLLIGFITTIHHGTDLTSLNKLSGGSSLGLFSGLWLTATLLAFGMRYWHKTSHMPYWLIWLAPAGQQTLTMYLLLSISLALSNTAFLGISGGTIPTLVVVVTMWFLVIAMARSAVLRGWRDPITRWLSPSAS